MNSASARLLIGFVAFGAAACAPAVPAGPPYEAHVVALVDVGPDGQTPRYEVAKRRLTTITDWHNLAGSQLRMFGGGEFVIRERAGSVVLDGRLNNADPPSLRYNLDQDVVEPRDYSTLAMLSAYHAFEKTFESLEREAKLNVNGLLEGRPVEVFFEPRIRSESDVDATVTIKFNAFFVARQRQFGLARRSSLERAPLVADIMVISHEVGHLLFEDLFFGGVTPDCSEQPVSGRHEVPTRLSVEYAISGLNEGFADLVAFTVTGTTDVLAGQAFKRAWRSFIDPPFTYGEIDLCPGSFYCIGTLFARSLFQAFTVQGGDRTSDASRGMFAQAIFTALPGALATIGARGGLPAPEKNVLACEPREETASVPEYDGPIIGAFLDALVTHVESNLQGPLCEAFFANFGESGFPTATRKTCADR